MRRDIDDALNGWAYDPEPGAVAARQVRARDGRWVVQVRQELGLIQMETEGRPDGVRPHGFSTYLEYLRYRTERRTKSGKGQDDDWRMSPEHEREIDREFVQFHHRRIAWLALHRYERMLADAQHTLALLDFVRSHCEDTDFIDTHERFRGLVLFHSTQARTALALEDHRPEEAIDALREGMTTIEGHQVEWQESHDETLETPNGAFVDQLRQIEDEVRTRFDVGKTLREQLAEAIAREDYEEAAALRDRMRSRDGE
jgi:hypothetical protein